MTASAAGVPATAAEAVRSLLAERRRLEARLLELRALAAQLSLQTAQDGARGETGSRDLAALVAALDGDLTRLADSIHAVHPHIAVGDTPRIEQLVLVRCSGARFALRSHAIVEIRRLQPDPLQQNASAQHPPLAHLLGLAHEAGQGSYAVIFRNGCSFAVDEILQQDELEVRNLPAPLAEMKIYAGAAVVAGEELVLVVDVLAMTEKQVECILPRFRSTATSWKR